MTSHAILPDHATLYQAFLDRDASFEGLFVAGVRTTGIFCRPTCSARKPKPENVEFFPRTGDALAAGYRPCKRCLPLQPKRDFPDWLQPLMSRVESNPQRRWTGQDLRQAGVDPARARRWFQAEHGMTFLAYLRSRRLGMAFSRLKEGCEVTEAALDSGFDSVSGFCDAFRKRTGSSPSAARSQRSLSVQQLHSPLGPLMIAGDDTQVYLVEFWDRRMLETQFRALEQRLGAVFFPGATAATRHMAEELTAYFRGQLRRFQTRIRFPGTTHQQSVWRALQEVPYGETWTYAQLARHLGKPGATRAVARAVGENRLAIVVPCHRIVGASGALTGYGGGLWRKRFLLQQEQGFLQPSD